MKWIDYREALGVSFSDSDKVEMLNNKIIVLFDSLPDIPYQSEEKVCKRYFSDVGERTPNGYYTWHEVKKSIIKKPTASDLISYTIAFSNASKKEQMIRIGESVFCDLIRYLDELKIDYEVIKDDNGYFLFPKGAKELDEANVNIPFEWLRKYPQARQSMEVALRHYSNKERPSQVADDFRKALETFAKEFFQNDRSLENQKTEFGKYLKEKGVPKELAGNFETTLQMYTNYMNNFAKHNDNTSEKFLEFIMYQTGNIIRFVISLEETE